MFLLYKAPDILMTLNVYSQFDLTRIKSFYITRISNFQTHIGIYLQILVHS